MHAHDPRQEFFERMRHGSYDLGNTYIAIRHGEALGNRLGVQMGQLDLPLVRSGVEAAVAAHPTLTSLPVDEWYSGDLIRQGHTVQLGIGYASPVWQSGGLQPQIAAINHTIRSRAVESPEPLPEITLPPELPDETYKLVPIADDPSVPIRYDYRLRERRKGDIEGFPRETYGRWFPEAARVDAPNSYDYAPPGGESFTSVEARFLDLLFDIETEHQGKVIGLSTSHGVMKVAQPIFKGVPREQATKMKFDYAVPIILYHSEHTIDVTAATQVREASVSSISDRVAHITPEPVHHQSGIDPAVRRAVDLYHQGEFAQAVAAVRGSIPSTDQLEACVTQLAEQVSSTHAADPGDVAYRFFKNLQGG